MFTHHWKPFKAVPNQVVPGNRVFFHRLFSFITQILILALTLSVIGITPALAAGTLVVTKTTDTNDGVCDNDCSLREAIAATVSGDTIIFDSGLSGGIIRLASTLNLSKNITIDGSTLASQITISGDTDDDGAGNVRVLYNNGATVTLKNLTIEKGIYNVDAGGIKNTGTLTIRNSAFSDNSTGWDGGAIQNSGILTITDTTFSNNLAGWGGAISNIGTLLITNSSFMENQSGQSGGAISNTGTLTVANSTFSGNHTNTAGGAIDGAKTITNSTFMGNYAERGGGISGSSMTLSNNTFSGNIALDGSGGGVYNSGGTLHFANNIIANSTGSDCRYTGTFITNINNLVEDGSCLAALSGDPRLSALADNGGSTKTMALVSGSPAIDAGDDTICAASPVNNLDQRGVTRPVGAHCDIGAYEGSIPTTKNTFKSISTQDGWILESSETSNKGDTLNSTATLLYVGDNAQDKQYRSILSFNTSSLPDDAVITKVQLKVKVQGFVGGNMFTPTKILGNMLVDICKPYFGSNANLAVSDFQAGASKNSVGILSSVPGTGWRTITLKSTAYNYINLTDKTQFRLRFTKDDNDDLAADYLKIFSGDAPAASRPQLIVEYYVP